MQTRTAPQLDVSRGYPRAVVLAVITAALGFFVDAYDLLLYSIVRNASLAGAGGGRGTNRGRLVHLLNAQLMGMLIGGIVWGVLGDTAAGGRLFGSIIFYSAATSPTASSRMCRSTPCAGSSPGIGLAGELGAGVTLVSELMRSSTAATAR